MNDAQHRVLFDRYRFLYPPGTRLEPDSFERRYDEALSFAKEHRIPKAELFAVVACFRESIG